MDNHAHIRKEVAKLCTQYPGEYWRIRDGERAGNEAVQIYVRAQSSSVTRPAIAKATSAE